VYTAIAHSNTHKHVLNSSYIRLLVVCLCADSFCNFYVSIFRVFGLGYCKFDVSTSAVDLPVKTRLRNELLC